MTTTTRREPAALRHEGRGDDRCREHAPGGIRVTYWQTMKPGCPVCNGTGRKAVRRSMYSYHIVNCECWWGFAELGGEA